MRDMMADTHKTLLVFYYAGHGMMDNHTYAVLNGPKLFPLEKMLRAFSDHEHAYVIGIFDCCRAKINESTRSAEDRLADVFNEVENKQRMVIVHSCPPSSYTPAESTMSLAFFSKVNNSQKPIPDCLMGWRGGDAKGECMILTDVPLRIKT